MAYCGQLPFRILSYCRYIDLEKRKVLFCKIEKDENRLLWTKSKKNGYCFNVIKYAFTHKVFKKFKRKR